MAKIGLKNFRYSKLTEAADGTPTYAGAKKPAKAISCNDEVTLNEATLYADDGLAETDNSFARANVTIGIDDDDQATMAELLGHEVDQTSSVMKRNANDEAPYVGLGRVITKKVGGNLKYKVEFLYKVKFVEPNQSENTKGENTEFSTTELSGVASTLANGDWSETKTFTSQQEAITYLEGLLAAPSGSGAAQSGNGN